MPRNFRDGTLARALQLRIALARNAIKIQALAETIDRLRAGIILVQDKGIATHVNRAAREIAARADGLSLDRNGMPHAADRRVDNDIARTCANVRSGGSGGIIRVPRKNARPSYVLLITPLPSIAASFAADPLRPSTLVVIHDPDASVADEPETVAAVFGLPIGTARLVSALANGEDAKSYAERHDISMNAIKFHLRIAFARTGLRGQTRLLQAVSRALSDLGRGNH
jgi:hypothetical protein